MIHTISVQFAWMNEHPPVDWRDIPHHQLHGLLYRSVLPAVSQDETDWLHEHHAPKPFSVSPLLGKDYALLGLRYTAFNGRTAQLLHDGWQQARVSKNPLSLADQTLHVGDVTANLETDFATLLESESRRRLSLRFLSPTAFRRGPIMLPLPLPANVFDRPFQMWQSYAPAALQLPPAWPSWCEEHVFVSYHHIRTVNVAITRRGRWTGFLGNVSFGAKGKDETSLRVWQALGRFATYTGIGHKTTMGLGSVALRDS